MEPSAGAAKRMMVNKNGGMNARIRAMCKALIQSPFAPCTSASNRKPREGATGNMIFLLLEFRFIVAPR